MKKPRILRNRPVDPYKDMPERFRHLTDKSVIKAKIDMHMCQRNGSGRVFTQGRYYIVNKKITAMIQMMNGSDRNVDLYAEDDKDLPHYLSSWYMNFELIL